ncbi:transposase [Catalinimonas sp. 4WD22]|uniref:transposase n=1 Tax=Catalinimonas locisalis TaxID=3133978 RepID=UPI0031016AAE
MRWQRDFMIHLMPLLLTIRGRHNFENFSRYGSFNEATYRVRYEGCFAFEQFNEELILSLPEEERIIAFDPSYISKSGNHTPGTGHFWSGCANATKYGLEISGLASVGLESRTAMHLYAKQTIGQDQFGSLLDYYASIVINQADRLKAVSDILVADGYFWRRPFVDAVTQAGFMFISKLPSNAVLQYPYLGPKPKKRGRPPKYQGRVDLLNLDSAHFTLCLQDDNLTAYEGKVYVKALDRLVKCVIVHLARKDGTLRAEAFFATDPTMDGAKVLECYRLRFQIEFLYRDAKQHTGLMQCQARSESKFHTHVNASLTAVSLAKAAHAWPQAGEQRKAFSLSSIKTQYFNEHLLNRFFREFGMNTETHKNSQQYHTLYNYGCIAA